MIIYFTLLICLVIGQGAIDLTNPEVISMLTDRNYVIREFVSYTTNMQLDRYTTNEGQCCSFWLVGVFCQKDTCGFNHVVYCNNDMFRDYYPLTRMFGPNRINLLKVLGTETCFTGLLRYQILDYNLRFWDERFVPKEERARLVGKARGFLSGGNAIIDANHMNNCDNRMGLGCRVACLPRNDNQRCDPVTAQIVCRLQFSGNDCLTPFNPCDGNPCLNGGICRSVSGGFQCNCRNNFMGLNCENLPMVNDACLAGSVVLGLNGCQCASDRSGLTCQQVICPTVSYCKNNGMCVAEGDSISCKCEKTTTGTLCEHRCFSECLNGMCDLIDGKPFCACSVGFTGPACDRSENIRDCPLLNPCLNRGTCSNGRGEIPFVCQCPREWKGRLCEIPSCSFENCRNGLCITNNVCNCKANFFGSTCDTKLCSLDDSCSNQGSCIQASQNNIRCRCFNNFAGINCEHKCSNSCGLFGRCVLTSYGPSCECDENHQGESCEILIETVQCRNLNCLNRGLCLKTGERFSCRCNEQWTGRRCEMSTCSSRNCERGVCLSNKGCNCIEGFIGSSCSTPICTRNFCKNNGFCVPDGVRRSCVCDKRASVGPRCEVLCPSRCVNGECSFTKDFIPKCQCLTGFTGDSCETRNHIILISYILIGCAAFTVFMFLVCVLILIIAKTVFKQEGDAETYIYRVEDALQDKTNNWNNMTLE